MRGGRWIGVCLWFLAGLVAVPSPGQILEREGLRLDGTLFFRTRYDDNIYLADDDREQERRTGEGGEEDFIFRPGGSLSLLATPSDLHEFLLGYGLYSDQYLDAHDEDIVHHSAQVSHRWRIGPAVQLLSGVNGAYHDQQPGAEFYRTDYWEVEPFTVLEAEPTATDRLRAGYRYQYRDYERIPDTPFGDYFSHEFAGEWRHRWGSALISDIAGLYNTRNYHEPALDEDGNDPVDGDLRDDDQYEFQAALTRLFGDRTALRVAYRYTRNDSTGTFYEYDQHRPSILLLHRFAFWEGLVGTAYAHYRMRDYDAQEAQRVIGDDLTVDRGETRADDQLFVQLRLEKEWAGCWTTDVGYTYMRNDSNDDSSEYEDNRVEMGVGYRF